MVVLCGHLVHHEHGHGEGVGGEPQGVQVEAEVGQLGHHQPGEPAVRGRRGGLPGSPGGHLPVVTALGGLYGGPGAWPGPPVTQGAHVVRGPWLVLGGRGWPPCGGGERSSGWRRYNWFLATIQGSGGRAQPTIPQAATRRGGRLFEPFLIK